MLQDKYLPTFHFSEYHAKEVNASPAKLWPLIATMDFSGSWIIRILFRLRGLPARMMTMEGLNKGRFICLERKHEEEIIVGLIGQFWRPHGNLQLFKPDEFVTFQTAGFCKATWSFRLLPIDANRTKVETITRIYCTDARSHKKFAQYWLFIKPFSGLIRHEILRGIRNKAEQ